MDYSKIETFSLVKHPELTEKWVQERIAEDPAIMGLGDLILKDKERQQPGAGRLDLLLQDAESSRRFEVEIQLGKTDESHIIRTIEYWDIERKRYPQYDHAAVIVAEEITSRFLNVISLFNGMIPLIAIQMKAVKLGDAAGLLFTTVLDQVELGLVDEDEEVAETTDRAYWERRATPETVEMTDRMLAPLREVDPGLELKYNKFYIGVALNDQARNFVIFRPQKNALQVTVKVPRSDDIEEKLEDAGLDLIDFSARHGGYRLRLRSHEIDDQSAFLVELFRRAFEDFRS